MVKGNESLDRSSGLAIGHLHQCQRNDGASDLVARPIASLDAPASLRARLTTASSKVCPADGARVQSVAGSSNPDGVPTSDFRVSSSTMMPSNSQYPCSTLLTFHTTGIGSTRSRGTDTSASSRRFSSRARNSKHSCTLSRDCRHPADRRSRSFQDSKIAFDIAFGDQCEIWSSASSARAAATSSGLHPASTAASAQRAKTRPSASWHLRKRSG